MSTVKISLRPPRQDDLGFIRRMWADEDTMKPVGGPVVMTDEQARDWFTHKIDPGNPSDCYRLIADREGRIIGEVSYRGLEPQTQTAFFNIKIMHVERGKGYAKEAMREFLDMFFNQHDGRAMVDDVALDNVAGQELLIHFGFEHDPTVADVFRARLTRERFNTLHGRDRIHRP